MKKNYVAKCKTILCFLFIMLTAQNFYAQDTEGDGVLNAIDQDDDKTIGFLIFLKVSTICHIKIVFETPVNPLLNHSSVIKVC